MSAAHELNKRAQAHSNSCHRISSFPWNRRHICKGSINRYGTVLHINGEICSGIGKRTKLEHQTQTPVIAVCADHEKWSRKKHVFSKCQHTLELSCFFWRMLGWFYQNTETGHGIRRIDTGQTILHNFCFRQKFACELESFWSGFFDLHRPQYAENASSISTRTFYQEGERKLPGLLAERLLSR